MIAIGWTANELAINSSRVHLQGRCHHEVNMLTS
jgi:hypothetical protein